MEFGKDDLFGANETTEFPVFKTAQLDSLIKHPGVVLQNTVNRKTFTSNSLLSLNVRCVESCLNHVLDVKVTQPLSLLSKLPVTKSYVTKCHVAYGLSIGDSVSCPCSGWLSGEHISDRVYG